MKLASTLKIVCFACALLTMHSTQAQFFPDLKLVAVHQLDQYVFAHTFKTNSFHESSLSDEQPMNLAIKEIDSSIERLLSIDGVSEASFDHATSTFTIISSHVSIEEEIERLKRQR